MEGANSDFRANRHEREGDQKMSKLRDVIHEYSLRHLRRFLWDPLKSVMANVFPAPAPRLMSLSTTSSAWPASIYRPVLSAPLLKKTHKSRIFLQRLLHTCEYIMDKNSKQSGIHMKVLKWCVKSRQMFEIFWDFFSGLVIIWHLNTE